MDRDPLITLRQWVDASRCGTKDQRVAFETAMLEADERMEARGYAECGCSRADTSLDLWDIGFSFWLTAHGIKHA
jgi:hypothetical protein